MEEKRTPKQKKDFTMSAMVNLSVRIHGNPMSHFVIVISMYT